MPRERSGEDQFDKASAGRFRPFGVSVFPIVAALREYERRCHPTSKFKMRDSTKPQDWGFLGIYKHGYSSTPKRCIFKTGCKCIYLQMNYEFKAY